MNLKNLVFLLSANFIFALSALSASSQEISQRLDNNTEILVVSDIDDTIKLSHVLKTRSAIVRARDANSWFLGMNSLYQLINNDNPSIHFAYISAAPEFALEGIHKQLLQNGQFPLGDYIARTDFVSSLNHKLNAIRELLNSRKPRKVIFIGDNGEKDPVVYNQISQEFKDQGIQFYTYIRMVYSKSNPEYADELQPIYPGQFVFVTPVELGVSLRQQSLISDASTEWLVDKLTDFILGETTTSRFGVLAFPSFLDCRGYQWPKSLQNNSSVRQLLGSNYLLKKFNSLKKRVQTRCLHSSDDDDND